MVMLKSVGNTGQVILCHVASEIHNFLGREKSESQTPVKRRPALPPMVVNCQWNKQQMIIKD